jgi:hypothetical protein
MKGVQQWGTFGLVQISTHHITRFFKEPQKLKETSFK